MDPDFEEGNLLVRREGCTFEVRRDVIKDAGSGAGRTRVEGGAISLAGI